MRQRDLTKRYYRDFLIGMAIYIVALVASLRYAPTLSPGVWATLAHLSPMLGFGFVLRGMLRWYADADEYQRRVTLENAAIAAAITAVASFTYGFLENAGFPRLSMFVVWPVLGGSMALLLLFRTVRGR